MRGSERIHKRWSPTQAVAVALGGAGERLRHVGSKADNRLAEAMRRLPAVVRRWRWRLCIHDERRKHIGKQRHIRSQAVRQQAAQAPARVEVSHWRVASAHRATPAPSPSAAAMLLVDRQAQ